MPLNFLTLCSFSLVLHEDGVWISGGNNLRFWIHLFLFSGLLVEICVMMIFMIVFRQEYIKSSRGVQLFTCRWLPANSCSPKALVFLCHGIFLPWTLSLSLSGISQSHQWYWSVLLDVWCELLSSLMEFAGYGMECSGFMRGNEFPLVTSFVFLYVIYFSCNVLLFMLANLKACPVFFFWSLET